MNDPIVVTRSLVKRAWSDIEPKLVWALLSGQGASVILSLTTSYGIKLSEWQQNELVLGLAIIGGWIAPSVGTTVTRTVEAASRRLVQSEAHTGQVVSTITGPTPIQPPAPGPSPAVTNRGRDSVTAILNGETVPPAQDQATAVLPSAARQFLAARQAQADGTPVDAAATDGH